MKLEICVTFERIEEEILFRDRTLEAIQNSSSQILSHERTILINAVSNIRPISVADIVEIQKTISVVINRIQTTLENLQNEVPTSALISFWTHQLEVFQIIQQFFEDVDKEIKSKEIL